jgi:hypothetical protein
VAMWEKSKSSRAVARKVEASKRKLLVAVSMGLENFHIKTFIAQVNISIDDWNGTH